MNEVKDNFNLQNIKNASIVVTGAGGFVGSNLVLRLAAQYPHMSIVALDKVSYPLTYQQECSTLYKNIKLLQCDMFDLKDLKAKLLRITRLECVIHAAALASVDYSFTHPYETMKNNVDSTLNLLQTLAEHPSRQLVHLIHISTDEVLGPGSPLSSSSYNPAVYNPTNPYAASKAQCEIIVRSYAAISQMNACTIVRSNNIYGPRQSTDKLIPMTITRLLAGSPVPVHGDGSCKRRYIYIQDYIDAILLIMGQQPQDQPDGEVRLFNVASEFEFSNLEVINRISALMSDHTLNLQFVKDRVVNDSSYYIDGQALKDLGYRPRYEFEEGLRLTLDWLRLNPKYWTYSSDQNTI
ncbi:hypothetical protein MP228_011995 [Amoeboaphelidium protococcarum]|nr:hypothetical protein MP228_011995 [Amoeboaphelidium protococcarum]